MQLSDVIEQDRGLSRHDAPLCSMSSNALGHGVLTRHVRASVAAEWRPVQWHQKHGDPAPGDRGSRAACQAAPDATFR